jgi:hypothetical protein
MTMTCLNWLTFLTVRGVANSAIDLLTELIDDSANVGKNKNRKKKKDPLTKLPSSDEIRLLKETESMFKSNLFRMEMEELLNVCRPSDSEALKQAVKNLKHVLDKLPDKNVRFERW